MICTSSPGLPTCECLAPLRRVCRRLYEHGFTFFRLLTETNFCVSDATAGCPSIERFYYKAKLMFIYHPLIAACGEPNPDPTVSGKLCAESEASKKLDALIEKAMAAAEEENYEDLCK